MESEKAKQTIEECLICGTRERLVKCLECHKVFCNNRDPGRTVHILQHLKEGKHCYLDLANMGFNLPKDRKDQNIFNLHFSLGSDGITLFNRNKTIVTRRFSDPVIREGSLTDQLFSSGLYGKTVSFFGTGNSLEDLPPIPNTFSSTEEFIRFYSLYAKNDFKDQLASQDRVDGTLYLCHKADRYHGTVILDSARSWRPGNEVSFKSQQEQSQLFAEIEYIRGTEMTVLFESRPESYVKDDKYTIEVTNSDSVLKNQLKAIKRIDKMDEDLRNWILGIKGDINQPSGLITKDVDFSLDPSDPTFPEEMKDINQSQADAIHHALSIKVCLIKGPPGTGKTMTVSVLVQMMIKFLQKDERLLVCTPSNASMNHLFDKMIDRGVSAIRIVARVRQSDPRNHDEFSLHNFPDIHQLNQQLTKLRKGDAPIEIIRALEDKTTEESTRIVCNYSVVCCTTSVAANRCLKNISFQHVIIDESTQATVPDSLIPMTHQCTHVILVGDEKQLPPTTNNRRSSDEGNQSLFERLLGNGMSYRLLKIQYRMHPTISAFSNEEFYDGIIQNGENTLANVSNYPFPSIGHQIMFINADAGIEEVCEQGKSFMNCAEIRQIALVIDQLMDCGVTESQIGIITPYAAQKYAMLELMESGIKIDTVDAFQGRENDYIIFSCVRNNESLGIGFLDDRRRLNVAITRAKLGLIVVGSIKSLTGDRFFGWVQKNELFIAPVTKRRLEDGFLFWRRFIQHYNHRGAVVREFPVESDTIYRHIRNFESLSNIHSISSFVDYIIEKDIHFHKENISAFTEVFNRYLPYYTDSDLDYMHQLVHDHEDFWTAMTDSNLQSAIITLCINDLHELARHLTQFSNQFIEDYVQILFEKQRFDWCLDYCNKYPECEVLARMCSYAICYQKTGDVQEQKFILFNEESKIKLLNYIKSIDPQLAMLLASESDLEGKVQAFFKMNSSIKIINVVNSNGVQQLETCLDSISPHEVIGLSIEKKEKPKRGDLDAITFVCLAIEGYVFFVDFGQLIDFSAMESFYDLFCSKVLKFTLVGVNFKSITRSFVVLFDDHTFHFPKIIDFQAVDIINNPKGSLNDFSKKILSLEIREIKAVNWKRRPLSIVLVLLTTSIRFQIRSAATNAHVLLHLFNKTVQMYGLDSLNASDARLTVRLGCPCTGLQSASDASIMNPPLAPLDPSGGHCQPPERIAHARWISPPQPPVARNERAHLGYSSSVERDVQAHSVRGQPPPCPEGPDNLSLTPPSSGSLRRDCISGAESLGGSSHLPIQTSNSGRLNPTDGRAAVHLPPSEAGVLSGAIEIDPRIKVMIFPFEDSVGAELWKDDYQIRFGSKRIVICPHLHPDCSASPMQAVGFEYQDGIVVYSILDRIFVYSLSDVVRCFNEQRKFELLSRYFNQSHFLVSLNIESKILQLQRDFPQVTSHFREFPVGALVDLVEWVPYPEIRWPSMNRFHQAHCYLHILLDQHPEFGSQDPMKSSFACHCSFFEEKGPAPLRSPLVPEAPSRRSLVPPPRPESSQFVLDRIVCFKESMDYYSKYRQTLEKFILENTKFVVAIGVLATNDRFLMSVFNFVFSFPAQSIREDARFVELINFFSSQCFLIGECVMESFSALRDWLAPSEAPRLIVPRSSLDINRLPGRFSGMHIVSDPATRTHSFVHLLFDLVRDRDPEFLHIIPANLLCFATPVCTCCEVPG